jgi:hypothetical protein
LPDGTKIYCEHIVHHPPTSLFHVQPADESYDLFGNYEFLGKIDGNYLKAQQKGPTTIRFKDGHTIRYVLPVYRLGGMVGGDRTIEAYKNMYFEDVTNGVKAIIAFSTFESKGMISKKKKGRRDEFKGLIYKVKGFGDRTRPKDLIARFPLDKIKDVTKHKDKDKVKDIALIEGSWMYGLSIGGKKYWDMATDRP